MNQRLAAAQAALNSGRAADAIENLVAAIEADPAQSVGVYRTLLVQLYQATRYAEGERWGKAGVERFPRDFDLWNTLGVLRRRLKRFPEAMEALDTAAKLNPANPAAQVNRGNVLMDMREFVRAEQVFAKLVRKEPRTAEYQRQLGRSLLGQGKREAALMRFRLAVSLRKDAVDAWLDLIGYFSEELRNQEAEEIADKALAANPGNPRILESKAAVIRRSGQLRRAEAFLLDLLPQHENAAWLHYQLGSGISEYDRDRGNVHMRKAVELDPSVLDARFALIESLERTRTGDEGANIEEAYDLTRAALAQDMTALSPSHLKVAFEVLIRVCAFDEIAKLGSMGTLGRAWADSGKHTALLKILGQVRTPQDRFELLENHQIWGRAQEGRAAARPIKPPAPRTPDGRIRLGFMSSDLRRHPVGYFSLPLFEHIDRERFDVYCYSFYQGALDTTQDFITKQVAAYRWNPDISAPEAAQVIADDQLDILIELGGSTHMNKLEVMAYRPAPLQASWLGYPHSAGLSTIDYLVVDPSLMPKQPELLIEKPMMMPRSWIALGRLAFPEGHVIFPEPPCARDGVITFGTANNTYKYGPEMLATWARIVAAVPGSRFLFVRPEGSSRTFRRNVLAHFEAQGVAAGRVLFEPVRGAHMPHYNRIDIALDTFPQTGGTTTCEAAWMGVPTVSLVGPTLFERLSYSILVNSGLGDLCVTTVDDYVAKAVELAADRPRIAHLRANLREQLKASPLGQTEQFARDFYDLVARTVEAAKVKA
jgi:predicted O-linked N-acetylglucosamine transferase (SPINDLY family)